MREPPELLIRRPGLLTTVQDLGRYGYQRYGVSVSGAMDRAALRIGNRLVGNPDGAAGLEVTLLGPEMELRASTTIAITGADLSASVNDQPAAMWTALQAHAGDILRFGRRRTGARAYVCFRGGIDVPVVFASRSTDVGSGIGGFEGRRLAAGDCLRLGRMRSVSLGLSRGSLPSDARPPDPAPLVLRVMLGPQASAFSSHAIETLLARHYVVSPASDRMGYRLKGAPVPATSPAALLSDATTMGTIQVPPDQQPILLMADCQPTGGYPKIASIISVDLPRAGQLAPGDPLGFTLTTAEEARELYRKERASLDRVLPPFAFRGMRSKSARP